MKMKKFLTLAVVALASVFGVQAEGLYLGGSLGYMHNSKDHVSTNELTILPEIGYNFNDTWAVGTTVGYDYTHWCGRKTSLHLFEFNPYARFTYFRTENNLVQLFIDGGAGIGLGTYDNDGDDSDTAVTWNIGFRPGVAFNFTSRFSVVAHVGFLGYEGANNAAYNGGKARRGGLMLDGNDLTLGFYYNF